MELAASILWWWNPVFWSVRARLHAESELACDGWVVHIFPQDRRAYADALISACEEPAASGMSSLALGVRSDSLRELKRRLATIMTESVSFRLSRTAVAVFILTAAVTLPAWSQQATADHKLPFTLSKETTNITSPLNPDGTPDYVGALNEKYGQGVTPENNAFALWITDIADTRPGNGDFPDQTRDKIFEMAGVKSASPGAQHELWFGEYLIHKKGLTSREADREVDNADAVHSGVWTAQDHPLFADYLNDQKEILDKSVEAFNRPRWWSPSVSTDGWTMFRVLLPSLGRYRDVANNLSARAFLRAGAGDFKGFVSDAIAVEKEGRLLSHGPTLIERLVGIAIDHLGNETIGVVAGSGKLTAAQCAAVSQALASLPAPGTPAEAVDISERWTQHDFAILLATGSPHAFDMLHLMSSISATTQSSLQEERLTDNFRHVQREQVDWDYVLRRQNKIADDVVSMMQMADPVRRRESAQAYYQRLEQWKFEAERSTLVRGPEESRAAYSERVTCAIMAMMLINFDRSAELYQREIATKSMLQGLLTIAEDKAKTGSWPADLKEISVGPPSDLNNHFHVIIGPRGARVYSYGANGIDDGGRWNSQSGQDDIGIGPQ